MSSCVIEKSGVSAPLALTTSEDLLRMRSDALCNVFPSIDVV
jgi:hypothetical protein